VLFELVEVSGSITICHAGGGVKLNGF
jgi:hypothetical protein